MAPVARYTRFVVFSRRFLWVLVAGIIGLVFWIATDNSGSAGKRVVFTNLPQTEILQNIMLNPRYQGLDDQNQPYTVIADKAVQLDENNVSLDNIRAEITQKDGTWVALNSKAGEMNIDTKQLQLTGGVDLFSDSGYEMRTDHAHVDIEQGSAYGDAHVEGQGPAGTLQADSFKVFERGQVIRFNGSVKVRVYR